MAVPAPKIRRPRLDDVEAIVDYHRRCWQITYADLVDPRILRFLDQRDPTEAVDAWHARLAEGSDARIRVAADAADVPIAHVMTIGDELVHLFVDPDHHRQGIGRRLLAIGEQLIRDDGHERAVLHTLVGNVAAISLYESTGWVMTDELHVQELPDDMRFTEHILRVDFAARDAG